MLARADNYDARIHLSGTNCVQATCGNRSSGAYLPNVNGIVVRGGDSIWFRQYQTTAQGGMMIGYSDGTVTNWVLNDSDGQQLNNDTINNSWHLRHASLSSYAGKAISYIILLNEIGGADGQWDMWFSDISIINTDGQVTALYARQEQLALTPVIIFDQNSVTGLTTQVEFSDTPGDAVQPAYTTTYYYGDHLGSSRLTTNGTNGTAWPIWSTTYLPFGQEWSQQNGANHYKFTGDERDSETGLDHTTFRQYSSSLGRWTTPDPAGLAVIDTTNPQTWNRYAYVGNNPLVFTDPLGLYLYDCTWSGNCSGLEGRAAAGVFPWMVHRKPLSVARDSAATDRSPARITFATASRTAATIFNLSPEVEAPAAT